MAETTYRILKSTDPERQGDWMEYAVRDAKSAGDAIRAALITHPVDGVFVAIPARSWNPVTVTIETQTVPLIESKTIDAPVQA